ncbi:MAG: gliding motility-associated C-terminal domain-containing protein [Salegentibacter sp.]|uniref:gliding motility-associated C-terminal domain-containing protein n=1 Tax=Salegentibacter sp. TaxID=1903072 RepID=UPI00286FBA40|nr:gliding motility-associated C-terminal domain-containing protein [Salegentibacter sp.]MDR9456382.1 gliding motility-associated C-terminal domain-containing protein [Salegentibacter sp.]
MQNFTFGRKGTNWFLFAFVMLIGTLPSFGQANDCATVDDDDIGTAGNQQFFCYLSTVDEIKSTGGTNTAIFESADTVNDTQPIDPNELLSTATYYVGSTTEVCNRVAVEVTVTSADTPDNSLFPGQNNFTLSPCLSSNFTADDLEALFTVDAGNNYSIVVYTSEFGEQIAVGTEELVPGESYYVAQVSSVDGECPSTRAAVGYNPTEAPTPVAEPTQTFCEGATVADLVAAGTEDNTQAIRWYRSATSSSPLADDVELINGEDYFASQVVNDRNDIFPPCETPATDRAEVTVTIVEGPDAGADAAGIICETDVQDTFPSENAVENFYLSLLENGVPTDGTFSPSISQMVSQFQNDTDGLGDFTTTYTIGENDCSDSVDLTISVIAAEDAEAGDDYSAEYCVTQDEDLDLYSFLSDDAIKTGEFSAPFEDGIFNPSAEGEGTYTITYSVNEDNSCVNGSDEATFTLEVNEVNEENITINIDPSEFQGMTAEEALNEVSSRFAPYFDGVPEDGDFDPALEVAFADLDPGNPEGNYTVSYLGNSCEILNFTVIIAEQPITDEPFVGIVCETDVQETFPSNDEVRKYYLALLPSGTPTNGTFNPTIDQMVTQFQNDADGLGDFTTTYTVNNESFELTIRIIPTIEANAGEGQTVTYCTGAGEQDLYALLSDDANEDGVFEGYEDGVFNPSVEGEGTYVITYSVTDEVACVTGTASATFTINVNEGDANAGSDNIAIVCETDVQETFPSVDEIRKYLLSMLDEGVDRTGTFSPTPAQLADIYQDDEDGLGDFTTTYTLQDGECSDSAELTIRVIEAIEANAGDDFATTFCSNEEDQDLYSFLSEDANANGYFEGYEDGIFSPSEQGAGVYDFNYVVDDSSACVEGEDTAAFSIEVFEAPNAGEDFAETICITEAEEMIANPQAALDWFNSIVDVEGVDQDGEFDPALSGLAADIIAYVNTPDSPSATFETTYTVSNDNCEDSANISLTINNLEEANAGENVELTFCVSQGDQNLYDYLSDGANPNGYFEDFDGTISPSELGEGTYTYTYIVDESVDCVTGEDSVEFTVEVIGDIFVGNDNQEFICNAEIVAGMFPTEASVRSFYLNMLDEGVSRDGTFSPSILDLMDAYNNDDNIGDFTTTYTLTEGECSASVDLTITVYESIPAEIDPIDDVTLCSIDDDQDMFSFLPEGADTNGYFEGYEDGMFSPSTTGAGEFEVTYTLDETSPCVTGEASATFTITVLETVTAGENMTASFCATDGEQDLYNFLDAEASTDGEFTYNDEVLVDGMFDASAMGAGSYDVTYTVEPINECGVATSILTVTVNEVPDAPAAPELDAFCAIEMATGADLPMAEGQTWYADADLTTMVAAEDVLEDGAYYLTVTSENGCESEATEVTVSVNDSPAPTISSTNLEFCDADNPTIAELTAEIVESGDITWYDSEDGTNALGTSTTLTSGTYYATLTGETGCESSQRLAVTVSVENCPILYPEAITPNGDGRNDTFIIENITNEYPNYSIEIFNRWGNVIYKGNASTPAWDGTSNQSGSFGDDVLPVGVYFYVIDFSDGSTEPKQGKVYLSR